MPHQHHLRADALTLLVTLLAAAGWVFSRGALQGLPPVFFIGVRFLLAGLLLSAIGSRQLKGLPPRNWRRALVTGAVMSISIVLWVLGMARATNLGVGAFINSVGVVLAPVVGRAVFKLGASTSTWIAVAVAAVGLGCLSSRGGLQFSSSDLFFIASATVSALYLNLNARYAARMSVVALAAVQLTVVGAVALPVSALFERWPSSVGLAVVAYFLASTLISTSLRFLVQAKAQSLVPVSHAAIIMTLEPVWTALIGAGWLGERMRGLQLVGCLLVASALLIGRWRWILLLYRGGEEDPGGAAPDTDTR